ncbi:unnamed protein product [Hyaloperonospora brassicae]|uniref:RxLR effector candidate protein n=1 Tax=Hyaloperonospora brassicae TaxID=162125 RepID=A0AAV0UUT2_HYABA|nr:unnamed protein product [Hyaloperonospora brassicae]
MDDTFDSGKRGQVGSSTSVEIADVDKATDGAYRDDYSNQDEDDGMTEQPAVPVSTNERPQLQQRQSSRRQPQQSRQPNVEYPLKSKRHSRTRSLKLLSEPPVEKRYGRVGRASATSSTPAPASR